MCYHSLCCKAVIPFRFKRKQCYSVWHILNASAKLLRSTGPQTSENHTTCTCRATTWRVFV